MSFIPTQFTQPMEWWNQGREDNSGEPFNDFYGSVNSFQYPMNHLSYESNAMSSLPTTQVNAATQNNLSFPAFWSGDAASFADPTSAYNLTSHPISFQYTSGAASNQIASSASLPPAAFTKYPLAIDQFSVNTVPAIDTSTLDPFYTCDQPLPVSEVPALDYESTSPDEIGYARTAWTDSPVAKVEEEEGSLAGSLAAAETGESSDNADPCYAELLRQALMDADNHTMLLKDLYSWVRTHSTKAQDPNNRGWQNSVRHNLSMNAAFERVPPVSQEAGTKKTSHWRLTQHAVEHGIRSTTRYRKDSKRKSQRNPNPAPNRVMSGAKGGQATRRSARRQPVTTAPHGGSSPSSGIARQRNFHGPYQARRYPIARAGMSPSQRRTLMASAESSPYFDNAADMIEQLPHTRISDVKIDGSHEFFPPYGATRSFADWSLSPSPLSHANSDVAWLNHQQNPGL